MKWIWIGETTKIGDKWFLFGQCYEYTTIETKLVDCWTACSDNRLNAIMKQTIMPHYIVPVNNVTYSVPALVGVEVSAPIQDHDQPRQELAWRGYIDRTPDMIKAWKKASGVDISAKERMDKADYRDESAYKAIEKRLIEEGKAKLVRQ